METWVVPKKMGGTPKSSRVFYSVFHGFSSINIYKPSILGYPHLWQLMAFPSMAEKRISTTHEQFDLVILSMFDQPWHLDENTSLLRVKHALFEGGKPWGGNSTCLKEFST